jgi:hypothetical protein
VVEAFNIAGGGEVLVGAALVLLLVLVLIKMMRSRKPDPKMEFLLALLKDFPKGGGSGNPASGDPEDDPRKDHGPLGPDSFSGIAASSSDRRPFKSCPDEWDCRTLEGAETIPHLPLRGTISFDACCGRARTDLR